jgi:NTE family protein
MSYPFAFQPVRVGTRLLVDGGLCSNLPVFLFEKERQADRLPLLAFDLVSEGSFDGEWSLGKYIARMVDTALEAGDYLMREVLCDVHHVPIPIPPETHALDFDVTEKELKHLFMLGYTTANEYIQQELAMWRQAANEIESIQAQHARPEEVQFVLKHFAQHLEREAKLSSVRSNVMLPTSGGARVVVYQFNMDSDADQDLELAEDAGCSGACWTTRKPAYADLEDAAAGDNYVKWKMTAAQQAKVRHDRRTMVSIPIFAPGSDDRLVGVLSADSSTSIARKGRLRQPKEEVLTQIIEIGKKWAVVLTAMLG